MKAQIGFSGCKIPHNHGGGPSVSETRWVLLRYARCNGNLILVSAGWLPRNARGNRMKSSYSGSSSPDC